MKTELEHLEDNKVLLKVEVPAEDLQKAIDSAFREVGRHVAIPGFRKGKVPRRVLQTRLGMEAIYDEVLEHDLPGYYSEAVREAGIEPVSQPEVDVVEIEEGKPLVFTATVEVLPTVESVEWKGVEVEPPEYEVTDEELGKALDNLRENFAKLEDMPGKKLDEGDFALIDYAGSVNNVPLEEGTIDDFMLEIGSGNLWPEFHDELKGKRKGDILDIKVAMPEDYKDAAMAGQVASFKVIVKEVKVKKLPDLDDDFAKEASEFDTVEELKADLAEKMGEMKRQRADQKLQQEALAKLVEKTEIDVPQSMVDEYVKDRHARLEQILGSYGIGVADYMASSDRDKETMDAEFADDARKSIKARLILDAVVRTEGIQVSDDELEKELVARAESMQTDADTYRDFLMQRGTLEAFKEEMAREKALKLIVENAVHS